MKSTHATGRFVVILLMLFAATDALSQMQLTQARTKIDMLKSTAPKKDEFETSTQFERRKAELLETNQKEILKLVNATYSEAFPVKYGKYDADRQLLTLLISSPSLSDSLEIKMDPANAKTIKPDLARAKGSGTFWLEEDGRAFLLGSASIQVAGKKLISEPGPVRVRFREVTRVPVAPRLLAFSPDGSLLALVPVSSNTVEFWDLKENHRVNSLSLSIEPNAISFFPGGSILAVLTSEDLQFFRIPDNAQIAKLKIVRKEGVIRDNDWIAFSRDGVYLQVLSGGTSVGWDVRAHHRLTASLKMDQVVRPTTSPDGRWTAKFNDQPNGTQPQAIVLYDQKDGVPGRSFELRGESKGVAFSFDGNLLAFGNYPNTEVRTVSYVNLGGASPADSTVFVTHPLSAQEFETGVTDIAHNETVLDH